MNLDSKINHTEGQPEFPNVMEYKRLAELPDDIGFPIPTDEESPIGVDLIGEEIQNIILANQHKLSGVRSEWLGPNEKTFLIGQIIPGILQNYNSRKIIELLLEKYPNLHWARGGELKISKGAPVLDEAMGMADGYVGDLRALFYAFKNYDGQPRKNPVLYLVSLTDLIEGARQKAVNIGSQHRYDVSLGVKDPEAFTQWSKSGLKVYSVPQDEEGRKKMIELLASKSIKTS